MWVCVVGICIQLIYGLPTTILGIVSDTKNISFYSISHTIYGFVYLFASALDNVFMPKVSYIENEQYKTERINQLMIKVGRCQLLIVGLIVSGFAIFGRLFLTLWKQMADTAKSFFAILTETMLHDACMKSWAFL